MPPKDLETTLLLRRTKEIELFPKVNTFLHSIERNSIRSKRSYSSGLTLLQNFLKAKEQQMKYEGCYNCETILQPLFENRISVYELFDSLVSYILSTKPEITPKYITFFYNNLLVIWRPMSPIDHKNLLNNLLLSPKIAFHR